MRLIAAPCHAPFINQPASDTFANIKNSEGVTCHSSQKIANVGTNLLQTWEQNHCKRRNEFVANVGLGIQEAW
jgi:hypothetical protein